MTDERMIEILEDEIRHSKGHLRQEGMCDEFYKELGEWVETLETSVILIKSKEADRWIPVSERLPEEGNKAYLTTVDYGNGVIASCQRFFFGEGIGWNDDCVIAWEPMPEPYESEDK